MAAGLIRAQEESAPADGSAGVTADPLRQSNFDARDRLRWILKATVGPKNLAAGVFVAGIQTWRNSPEEYQPHWDGYGKRYGVRIAAGGTSNVLEAGFGSLWGEDPRYYPATGEPLKIRLGHIVKMAFVTHNRERHEQLAYARYIAVPGGILISNTWRPDSPSTMGRVSYQVGMSFASRMISNAFSEFFPDIRKRFKRGGRNKSPASLHAGTTPGE